MAKFEVELPDDDDDSVDIEVDSAPSDEEKLDRSEKSATTKSEFDIEVVDDTPEEDRGREPAPPPDDVTDDELAEYSESVQKRIKRFTKGYHDERRAKEQAERERDELLAHMQRLQQERDQASESYGKTRSALLKQSLSSAEKQVEQIKKELGEAYEAGNTQAVVDAQDRLADAKYQLQRLRNIKLEPLQDEEGGVKQGNKGGEGADDAPQPRQPGPQLRPDPRAQRWKERNPWFGEDQEKTAFALGVHQKLVNDGVDPTSDDYYAAIDARMQQVFPEDFQPSAERKPNSVVAPATRTRAPKKVKLTQTQVRIAKRLGLSLEQYAKQVAEDMRKQGNG